MAKLNCRVGDLAITVRSNIPDNVGLVVRIVDICMYLDEWKGLEGPVHIWDVDLVCEDSRLVCFTDQPIPERLLYKSGPIPDAFLQPITPPIDLEKLLKAEALEDEQKKGTEGLQ